MLHMEGTSVNGNVTTGTLPPFPEGWYYVASRHELNRRKLIQKTWMGEQIVAWLDDQGRISVADAFCPHMGSALGPQAGGQVRDGCLVCPFHGFEYDSTGQCVATPYAPPPRSARLKLYETHEILGMVFAWWGLDGRQAGWHLPAEYEAGPGWSGIEMRHFHFAGHPQEIAENAVDLAHFSFVHGYGNVHRPEPLLIEGHYLRSAIDFKARMTIAGPLGMAYDVSTVSHVHGVGYSCVEMDERSTGLLARLWVFSTPVDGDRVHVALATQAKLTRPPSGLLFGLRLLPERARLKVLNLLVSRNQAMFVKQDEVMWKHKRFLPRPRLSRADGEIMAYRRYCEQFYPEQRKAGRRLLAG